jgi:hypothetical protein
MKPRRRSRRPRGRAPGPLPTALAVFLVLGAAVPVLAQWAGPGPDLVEREVLPHIRERFYDAVDDEAVTMELIGYIEAQFASDPSLYPPVIRAFYAALTGLRGRHDTNLLRKYRFVSDAIAMMDPIVEANPGLLEVRFLRFSFYEQIPAVFGVRQHVPEDLRGIIAALSSGGGTEVPRSVRVDMIDHILGTREPTAEQRKALQQLIGRLQ